MVYGSEAVLPTDLNYGAPKIRAYNEQGAEASHQDAMDQQALRRYHNRRVRGRSFNVGDLVLRLVQSNKDRHKLSPPWEGPYVIVEVLRPGAYRLKTINGEVFTNA